MTSSKTFFWLSLPPPFRVISVRSCAAFGAIEPLIAVVEPTGRMGACPDCGRNAQRVHSRYTRTLTDVSMRSHRIVLKVLVRRFVCRNRRCRRRIFCERLPGFAGVNSTRTDRLKRHLECIAMALGGRPGERYAHHEGQAVSPKTLLRYVRAMPCPEFQTPRFLGVDDWAMQKGRRYGTILCDLETHAPIDLLSDRTARSLADWLRVHPGVEVISRDRATAYAEGARLGAPRAIQVADRWRLAKNLGDALERFLNHKRNVLVDSQDSVSTRPESRTTVEVSPTSCCVRRADRKQASADREKEQRRVWRYGQYEQAKTCFRDGLNVSQIARTMHLDRKTVRSYLAADTFPERRQRARSSYPSVLETHKHEIARRWESGCHNGAEILREIRANGYTGGYTIVKDYLSTFRNAGTVGWDGASPQPIGARPSQCSPRAVVAIVLRKPEDRAAREEILLGEVERRCEPFHLFHVLAQEFLALMRGPKVKESAWTFSNWLTTAKGCEVAEVRRFAKSLEQDRAAVEAAMALPWSNGPVEGAVNRLKTIKRQMYGRANFDLLRRRVLEPI